jgi:hypothetical protein
MNDQTYAEFTREFRQAIKSVLVEMSAKSENESVALDELALAVKTKFKNVDFMCIMREVEHLLKENSIERVGYDCKLPILETLSLL